MHRIRQPPDITGQLAKQFKAASIRTASLYIESVQRGDKLAAMAYQRLLFYMPKLTLCSWAGEKWRGLAIANLRIYPAANAQYLSRLVRFCRKAPTPRSETQQIAAAKKKAKASRRGLRTTGCLSKAIRVLVGNGIASGDDEDITLLEKMHPRAPIGAEPFPQQRNITPRWRASDRDIITNIKDMPNDVRGGLDGWLPSHMKLAGEVFEVNLNAVDDDGEPIEVEGNTLIQALTMFTNLLAQGVSAEREWTIASRLVPLIKSFSPYKLRPVACGGLFLKIASKTALKATNPQDAALPCQHGASPGGAEVPIHRLRLQLEHGNIDEVELWDLENCFNNLDRTAIGEAVKEHCPQLYPFAAWLYCKPSDLYLHCSDGTSKIISSQQGVRQGCTFGTHFTQLTLKNRILELKNALPDLDISGFTDDHALVTYKGRSTTADGERVLDKARSIARSQGWINDGIILSKDERKQPKRFKAHDIVAGRVSFKYLGAFFGGGQSRIRAEMETALADLNKLTAIDHWNCHHLKLLTGRLCALQQVRFTLRTTPSEIAAKLGAEVDQWLLMHFISDLTGVPYDVLSSNETAMTITNLPMKRGGLGFLSQERMSPYAYAASLGMARAVMASRATEMIDLGFEDPGAMLNAQRSAGVPEVDTLPS
jgi:hypothetical protein